MNDRLPWHIIAYRILTIPLYYLAMCCMFTAIWLVLWDLRLAKEFWEEWKPSWDL